MDGEDHYYVPSDFYELSYLILTMTHFTGEITEVWRTYAHSPRGPSAPPLAGIGLPRERWQPDPVGRARAPSRTTLEPARAGVLQLLSHRQGVRHRPERNGKEKKPGRLLLHSWEKSQSGISKEREEGVQGITGSARRRSDELWFFPSLKSSPRHGP